MHITTSATSFVSSDITLQCVQHLIGQRFCGSRILACDEVARYDDFRLKEDVLISIAKERHDTVTHLPWLGLLVQPAETDQFALQHEGDLLSQQTLNSQTGIDLPPMSRTFTLSTISSSLLEKPVHALPAKMDFPSESVAPTSALYVVPEK
jgi:hypothetical protein